MASITNAIIDRSFLERLPNASPSPYSEERVYTVSESSSVLIQNSLLKDPHLLSIRIKKVENVSKLAFTFVWIDDKALEMQRHLRTCKVMEKTADDPQIYFKFPDEDFYCDVGKGENCFPKRFAKKGVNHTEIFDYQIVIERNTLLDAGQVKLDKTLSLERRVTDVLKIPGLAKIVADYVYDPDQVTAVFLCLCAINLGYINNPSQ